MVSLRCFVVNDAGTVTVNLLTLASLSLKMASLIACSINSDEMSLGKYSLLLKKYGWRFQVPSAKSAA